MIRAIVTDIEGTTSSISFVKDVLFPYAWKEIPAFVRENEKQVAGLLDEVRSIEKNPKLSTDEVITTLQRWIDEDQKITPLKALQGLIWQAGYAAGDFKGHIYDDALEGLQRWHAAGIKLYVYSSGSVPAQKLLFAHTPKGDLTPLFSGYFDTSTGPKLEAESYRKIARQINAPVNTILFLSDNPQEISAATEAGMETILVDRENNSPNSVKNFDQITIQEKAA
ncbi:MAG TPA: acireductone synthase [Alphaproteobacteria bacterium]|nr:acireductone synthase [Micavibrio sp.]MBK9561954.1 acireductone synthase [Micavibrio sp.]HQX27373.1 acireductone synthase [Alphaproteobacteria bacterium]